MHRQALVYLMAAAVGCGGSSATESSGRSAAPLEPAIRDSAGVTIYEHPADALERAPLITMDSTPIAVIGGADLKNDVTRLSSLVVLSDGSVSGFDGSTGSLEIFDPAGKRVRSVGRMGEGPEEFGRMSLGAWDTGDTIVVSDMGNSRIELVAPDSGIVRIRRLRLRGNAGVGQVAGRLSDGSWLLKEAFLLVGISSSEDLPLGRPPIPVVIIRSDTPTDAIDTLTMIPGKEFVRSKTRFNGKETEMDGLPIYGKRSIVDVWQHQAVVVTNEAWEVMRYNSEGTVVSLIRANVPDRPVGSEEIAIWKEAMHQSGLERAKDAGERKDQMLSDLEYSIENTKFAGQVPPFSSLQPTSGKLLWLGETQTTVSEPPVYTAIDPEGRIIGRLELPQGSRPEAFGDDRIILRTTDETDGTVRFKVHLLSMP